MTKAFIILCWIVVIGCVLAIITMPGDDACRQQVIKKEAAANDIDAGVGELAVRAGAGHVLKIENYLFYKTVAVKGTDHIVAYACFGCVILN